MSRCLPPSTTSSRRASTGWQDSLKHTLQGAAVVGRRFAARSWCPGHRRDDRIRSPATSTTSTASTSSSRVARSRADVQLQARADPGRRVREPPRAAPAPVPRGGGLGPRGAVRGPPRRRGGAPRVSLRPRRASTRRPSTTRSSPARRRSAGGPTPRRSPSSRPPQAPRDHAGHRGNRLRRIDAVVKQAEIKFALGRHAEHVQALEAIRALVEASADPPRRAAWYCWTGFLHSLTGARPEISDRRIARRRSAIADAGGPRRDARRSPSAASRTCTSLAGELRDALEVGRARAARSSRRAATCGGRAGRSGASAWPPTRSGLWARSLELLRAGARVRPGRQRSATQGRRLVAHRLDPHPAGRRGGGPCGAATTPSPCRPIPSTPPWQGRRTATVSSSLETSPRDRGSDRGGGVVRAVEPPLHPRVVRALAGRRLPAAGRA